jgi:glycosyltransferase involved in cell wall biosynthesis
MKILISAMACDPYEGSENYFGWAAVECLARDHDLWVLTSKRNRVPLEKGEAEGLVPKNVHFVYACEFKEWHPNRLLARFQSWKEYIDFSEAVLPAAYDLCRSIKFDVVHHVTLATWRVAMPLWKLGIPFILGPIGGYEKFPVRLLTILSPMATGFELFRMSSNVVSRFSPNVRKCIRRAAHVFVANMETEQLVRFIRGSDAGITRLTAAFHSDTRIRDFSRFISNKSLNGPLRLFAAGNMEGRKGVALALHALARVKKNGVKFHYRLSARGPEIPHLKRLAAKLDLNNEILFADNLRGENYQRELGETHIYLLPSLRDSAGLTLTEAMLAGCVPVVADGGGPGIMVTEDCGFKVPVLNREQMISQLAATITTIDRDRKVILEKGGAASRRIARGFSEDNYRNTVNSVYRSVLQPADG